MKGTDKNAAVALIRMPLINSYITEINVIKGTLAVTYLENMLPLTYQVIDKYQCQDK